MNTTLRRIIWLIIPIPAVYLALLWKKIPQTVPIHFDLQGNIDRYGTKQDLLYLIIGLTVLTTVVYLLITNIYKVDPKKYAAQNKERMQRIAFYVAAYLSAVFVMIIYTVVHDNSAFMMKFVFIAMGLLLALLGNNMHNIKPNYFAGIRLPWTLENEENWRKTHQFAGRLWFFGGLTFAVLVFLLNNKWAGYIGAVLLAVLIIIPIIYSYNFYRNQLKKI
jgi:uncharacterized membrane protein